MSDVFACMIQATRLTADRLKAGGPGSGPQGGGSSAASSSKSHSVKLPSNQSKMTITHANKALDQMGMKLGVGKSSVVGGKFVTTYSVTMPDGSVESMGTDEMKTLIYSGASK